MAENKQLSQWQTRLAKKIGNAQTVLSTPQGLQLMAALEQEMNGHDLRGGSVEDTYYNLGKRDVFMYLLQLSNASLEDLMKYRMED
jgi:hypothetical protein